MSGTTTVIDTQTWFEIEYSYRGADDWFTTANCADTEASIRSKLSEIEDDPKVDYRIVRKTLTSEVLS